MCLDRNLIKKRHNIVYELLEYDDQTWESNWDCYIAHRKNQLKTVN